MRKALQHLLGSSVACLADAFHLWWSGSELRRASCLCQRADALRIRREHGHKVRSSRLYRRAVAALSAGGSSEANASTSGDAAIDWATQAHRAIAAARQPYRGAVSAAFLLAAVAATLVTVIVALGCWVSPGLRAHLFPPDLAAGRPWTVTSADFGYPPNGTDPRSDGQAFFHTTIVTNPSVEIDLGAEHVLRKIRVENRSNCCKERAVPLNVEVWNGKDWDLIAQRRSTFSTWTYELPAVKAQRIRLRRMGSGYFHLKRVSVFGK
jgi:hypothetical protein